MTGLPSSIIKKYGVSKKAWAVYRGGKNMARKRKGRSSGTVRRRVHRFTSSRSGAASMQEILFSAGYGYFRQDIVGFASPLINMIPAGDYADNVTLGLGAYAVSWLFKPTGLVAAGLKTVVINESFVVGSKLRNGASLTTSSKSQAATTSYNAWS